MHRKWRDTGMIDSANDSRNRRSVIEKAIGSSGSCVLGEYGKSSPVSRHYRKKQTPESVVHINQIIQIPHLSNSAHDSLIGWGEEQGILLDPQHNLGLTRRWTKNALCLMDMPSSSSPTAWFLSGRLWNDFLGEGRLGMPSNVWAPGAASVLKVCSQSMYSLYFIVNIPKEKFDLKGED